MPTPILATKLYIPPLRPGFVLRARLLAQLNAGLSAGHRLILASAPAGFGKTTLLSSWVRQLDALPAATRARPIGVAWLSLDAGDSDAGRFLAYLVTAMQRLTANYNAGSVPPGSSLLAALQSPQPPPLETLLTMLINELSDSLGSSLLVLDDYHLVEATAVDQILNFLLEHLPPQLQLLIATREDPQLPLARLRARGQLTELRAADLRFTPTEAAEFLTQSMGLQLAAEDLAALDARTEGWIAGLQLAALSLQGQPDPREFLRSFTGSHRFVLDYLVEEVLQRQPEQILRFLLQTSILERLCGPLCDALGAENAEARSADILAGLERANLFLVPLDQERRWYRYHRLFADLLRQRLSTTLAPAELAGLHSRASHWYAANDFQHEAFQHAVAANDVERAADLAELAWPAMFRNYLQNTLFLEWMQALPEPLLRARPVLSAGYAWALLDIGDLQAAERHLRNAEAWIEAHSSQPDKPGAAAADEHFRALAASTSLARAFLSVARDDVPATVEYARRALMLLPEHDYFRRAGATAVLGVAYLRNGDLEAAYATTINGMAMVQQLDNLSFAISGTIILAGIRIAQGRLLEARRIYQQMLQLALEQGQPLPQGSAELYLGLSWLAIEKTDWQAAVQYLQRSEELGEAAGLPDWPYRVRLVQARLHELQGNASTALASLAEAERLYYPGPFPDLQPVAALKARVWIRQGKLHEALEWAQQQGLSANAEPSYLHEFEQLTLARLLLARSTREPASNALAEATGLLARLEQAATQGGRNGSLIEILLLQALAFAATGKRSAAFTALERALTLAAPQGYLQIVVDEAEPMRRLIEAFRSSRRTSEADQQLPAYVERLLRAFEQPAAPQPAPISAPGADLTEPLTQRELEILRLIAQGLSNQQIGERLNLALSTVKGHNLNIFGKLQVQRRTEAIARARELGLL